MSNKRAWKRRKHYCCFFHFTHTHTHGLTERCLSIGVWLYYARQFTYIRLSQSHDLHRLIFIIIHWYIRAVRCVNHAAHTRPRRHILVQNMYFQTRKNKNERQNLTTYRQHHWMCANGTNSVNVFTDFETSRTSFLFFLVLTCTLRIFDTNHSDFHQIFEINSLNFSLRISRFQLIGVKDGRH